MVASSFRKACFIECIFWFALCFPGTPAERDISIVPRAKPKMAAESPRADLRVDVPLVLIPTNVTTPLGTSVTTLSKENFRLFEDGVEEAVTAELLRWFRQRGAELAGVVPGNHDRGLTATAHDIKIHPDGYLLEGWRVVHGDGRLPAGRVVCGHLHPAVRLAGQTRPCYLVGERRIVLPAFSPDARGAAAAPGKRFRRLVPVGSEVLDFGPG